MTTIGTVSELLAILSCKESSAFLMGLRTLRKQWSMNEVCKLPRIGEEMPAFTCILRYAQSEPELPHIFERLGPLYQAVTAETTQVFLQVLGSVLEILKRSSSLKGVASKASRKLIKEHMKLFYRLLSANHNAVVAPTLDLLTVISSIDGSINEVLFGAFDFSLKSLPKFALMRKKVLAQEERHDIRTAYVHFILSFFKHGNYATKISLAKMQNLVGLVFAGIADDKPELIMEIFEAIKTGVLANEKKSKALPIAVIYASSLAKIAKLYESEVEEVVEAADALLRLICTNHEMGLVFRVGTDEGFLNQVGAIKNKILLDFLLSLNPLESLRKQQLCLDILTACPDILHSFWNKSSFSFEPEVSARFVNIVSFAVKVITQVPILPVIPSSEVTFLIPKSLSSASLQRGICHSNGLVSYFSSLLLSSCFARLESYLQLLEWHIELDSKNCNSPNLLGMRNDLIDSFLSRVPSGKTIFALYAQLLKDIKPASSQVIKQLLIVMRISSRLTVQHLEFGRNLIRIGPIHPVPALEESAMAAYWDYVVEACPFNFIQADIFYVVDEISTRSDCSALLRRLAFNALALSQFFNSQELAFAKRIIEKVEDAQVKSTVLSVLSCVAELKATRFIPRGSQLEPIFKILGASMTDLQAFSIPANSTTVQLDSNLLHKTLMGISKQDETEAHEQAEVPVLTGSNFSSIIEEIISLSRHDTITRAISKASFDQFIPVTGDTKSEELRKMLLVDFECSTWLQFLAKVFTSEEGCSTDLRVFIETGLLAFPLHGLTSENEEIWRASHFVLTKFYWILDGARFRERREVRLLMDCLKNTLQPDTRLSPVLAAFLCEALQVLLRPAHFMYAQVMELFLGQHSLDIRKVPLLMECLCSSSENMSREQSWMLRILLAGLRPGQDFQQTYQYNHVVPTLETLLLLPHLDVEVERLARQVLTKIFDHHVMQSDLITNHGLKAWIGCLPSKRSYMAEQFALAFDE